MMQDMLNGERHLMKTATCFATASAHSPIWVRPEDGCSNSQIGVFFRTFLDENPYPAKGIIAEKNVAEHCANIVCEQHGYTYETRGLTAYYSLKNTAPAQKKNRACTLHTASPEDLPIVKKWLTYFYQESLVSPSPELSPAKPAEPRTGKVSLYILKTPDSVAVAMGMLSDSEDISRLNLIYTPVEERRKGYGSALVSSLTEIAHQQGKTAMLYTSTDNTAANQLYKSLGFIEAGRLTEVWFRAALATVEK